MPVTVKPVYVTSVLIHHENCTISIRANVNVHALYHS